jgi:hypothetical protein
MLISKKLKPGQQGTKRLVTLYGGRQVCVRYRYYDEQRKRSKTVEIFVEESFWQPPAKVFRTTRSLDFVWGLGKLTFNAG